MAARNVGFPALRVVSGPRAAPAIAASMRAPGAAARARQVSTVHRLLRSRAVSHRHHVAAASTPAPARWHSTGSANAAWSPHDAIVEMAEPSAGGKRLRVRLAGVSGKDGDVVDTEFVLVWLRHNCPSYAHPSAAGQRTLPAAALPPKPRVRSAAPAEGGRSLWVEWDDGHTSTFKASWLARRSPSPGAIAWRKRGRAQPFAHNDELWVAHTSDEDFHSEAFMARWLTALRRDGVTLIRGVEFPDTSAAASQAEAEAALEAPLWELASRIAPVTTTLYGTMFHVVSLPDADNVAYTSERLQMHQDLVYYESPPGIQLLHCVAFDEDVVGGESVFVDLMATAERLRKEHPAAFEALSTLPAAFQKIRHSGEHPAHFTYERPIIRLNNKGELSGVTWAPPFEAPVQLSLDDTERYYEGYTTLARMLEEAPRHVFRMEPGDVVAFNNRRMLHGRESFGAGRRHMVGCYVNIDEFGSRERRLAISFYGEDDAPRPLGNQDYA